MTSSVIAVGPLPRKPLGFAWHVTKPYRAFALGATVCVVIAEALEALQTVVLKLFIDSATVAVASGDFARATMFALAYPAVFFVMESVWRGSGFCGMQWITKAEAATYRSLFAYLTAHSTAYFSSRFAGSLTNKISNVGRGLTSILSSYNWQFLPLVTNFLASLIIASYADIRIGIVLGVWVVFFIAFNAVLVRRKQPHSIAEAETGSILRGKMVDVTSNIATVHQYGQQAYEQHYLEDFVSGHRKAASKNWMLSEWILVCNGILQAFFLAGIFVVLVMLLRQGAITLGTVVMVIAMVVKIQGGLFFIGQKLNEFMNDYGQMQEGLQELLLPHEIVDAPGAPALLVRNASIQYNDVAFGYGKRHVFEHFTLAIPAGQKIGLVGHSGAGKSTFVHLLLRQYDVQEGSIAIDQQDVRSVTLESLRRNIAIVPQDISLFHRTVLENIRYGRLDALDEDVRRAAALAQADDFIGKLPHGYQTFVGERGVKLSGGQRQRIAVARAILKNAPILVLDEATSSLDSESEQEIQKALAKLMEGRTVIAIAHRLSTLRAMDRIVVFEEGRIVEDGTHESLLKAGGTYARLWESQVSGFIQE